MVRYVMFAWQAQDADQTATAHAFRERFRNVSAHWLEIARGQGLSVFCTTVKGQAAGYLSLDEGRSVLIGNLFSRRNESCSSREVTCLTGRDAERMVMSRGQSLADLYWGQYVAVLHDPTAGTTAFIRDPSGALPLLRTAFKGVHVFFSRVMDLEPLDLPRFVVNWNYITAHITSDSPHVSPETGLNDVWEILPGQCATYGADGLSNSWIWHPARFASGRSIEGMADAVEVLGRTVKNCIGAWGALHKIILHRLSGGLDSSIVLASLVSGSTRPQVLCVNYHSPGSDNDEREFARACAERAQCRLIEKERDEGLSLRPLLSLSRTARPGTYLQYLMHSEIEAEIAEQTGAVAISNGDFGDQLFYQNPALPVATDFIRSHGIRPKLFDVSLNVACLEGVTVWRVLQSALWGTLRRPGAGGLRKTSIFGTLLTPLAAGFVAETTPHRHPWVSDCLDLPPGKLSQIESLCMPVQTEDSVTGRNHCNQLSPLASQPIIETCLRIPVYLHLSAGWDRLVARRAFARDLPYPVVARRTKGGVEEYVQRILMRNATFIRQMLLDGCLVGKGLLDPDHVQTALSDDPSSVRTTPTEIYRHLSTEAWLRSC